MKTALAGIVSGGIGAAGGVGASWYVWDRTIVSMSWYVVGLIVLGICAIVAAVNWFRKRSTA